MLLDGHGSRFQLPFMEYIIDNSHPWVVCIGVPYGTSLWQVADSKQQNGSYKMALYKAKKELLEQKMHYMIDPLTLVPTDIIPIVNKAWDASFVNIDNNMTAIRDWGWNPLNYALLDHEDIKATMTGNDIVHYESLLKTNKETTNTAAITESINSASSLTISDVTGITSPNFDGRFLSPPAPVNEVCFSTQMNFKAGQSQKVLESLIHHHDLTQARENIRNNKSQGDLMKERAGEIKKLTAMYNFKNIGCRIGKDSLQLTQQMNEERLQKEQRRILEKEKKDEMKRKKVEMELKKRIAKEKERFETRKRKYDEVIALNLPDDKLSNRQLNDLINHKKLKNDTFITSKMKKNDLIELWKSMKNRPTPTCPPEECSTERATPSSKLQEPQSDNKVGMESTVELNETTAVFLFH